MNFGIELAPFEGYINALIDTYSMDLEFDVTNYDCSGNGGYIDLTVNGGTPPFMYRWNNHSQQEDINYPKIGNNVVTVTDKFGYQAYGVAKVEKESIDIEAIRVRKSDHWIAPENEIRLELKGGTPPYNISWSHFYIGDKPEFIISKDSMTCYFGHAVTEIYVVVTSSEGCKSSDLIY